MGTRQDDIDFIKNLRNKPSNYGYNRSNDNLRVSTEKYYRHGFSCYFRKRCECSFTNTFYVASIYDQHTGNVLVETCDNNFEDYAIQKAINKFAKQFK